MARNKEDAIGDDAMTYRPDCHRDCWCSLCESRWWRNLAVATGAIGVLLMFLALMLFVAVFGCGTAKVQAQEQRVLTRADFGTPTTVWMQTPPVSGCFDCGRGFAIRKMPAGGWHAGHWHVYTGTFVSGSPNREPLLEYEVSATFSGAATYVQTLGEIPHYGLMGGDSLFFDEDSERLCISSGSQYTYDDGRKTLACRAIDRATGKLTGDTAAWGFEGRPDRMTQSGVLRVRSETTAQRLKGHYVAGFGGTYSVISNGVSMGLAGCAFDLPAQSYVGRIPCTPILGYPVEPSGGRTYMNRDGDYTQVLGWDANPQRGSDAIALYGSGKFAPEDGLYGMAADIIDLPGAEAFVGFAEMQRGCIAYGDNHQNLPPIANDGPAVKPTSTDIAANTVTISTDWQTGQMVNIVGTSTPAVRPDTGGLMGGFYSVHFLRRVGPNVYTFHASKADALDATKAPEDITGAITAGVRPVSYCQAPSNPWPYNKGAVGSQGARHVVYFYDLDDLAAVARGEKAQNAIQPTSYANLELPGIAYPAPGMNQRPISGAQWVPELGRFFVAVNDGTPTRQGRRIYSYPVDGTLTLPPPKPTGLSLQGAP